MKKGIYALVAVTVAYICILTGIFIGRNTTDSYLYLPVVSVELADPEEAAENPSQIGKININTASRSQLMLLPGIGETIAQRIIDYRSSNGPFVSIEELLNVSGIGDKKLDEIRDYVTAAGG